MSLFEDAWTSLQRNRGTIAAYLAFTFALSLVDSLIGWGLAPDDPKAVPAWLPHYRIVSIVVFCALYSVLTSIFFARMGREIDRPLWKCADDREAVQRFFSTWFILSLLNSTMQAIVAHFHEAGQDTASAWCLLGFMIVFILTIPVGACIMYGGGLQWPVVHELLKPMLTMFPMTLNALSVALLEFVLLEGRVFFPVAIQKQILFGPVLNVMLTSLECYVFALMWRICMLHRDLPPGESNDFDF